MRRRIGGPQVLVGLLFVVACVLGAVSQRSRDVTFVPRARFDDATPLGGKGLRLLLSRLGYNVARIDKPLRQMPATARVWFLLDPQTEFSRREARLLLDWVRAGGTLIWATAPGWSGSNGDDESYASSLQHLYDELKITNNGGIGVFQSNYELLPPLSQLDPGAASVYWSGVSKAQGSKGVLDIGRAHLEIAGSPAGTELARIDVGKGRVFVAPDALLFTSHALSKPDNAVLVTNFVRAHVPSGAVYFDERHHQADDPDDPEAAAATSPTLLDYLWQPPLRYAMLQLLGAALLWWALSGRRLGAPVPLPERESVTRASLFALAMGALFRKADRPRAAASIIAEHFRRDVVRRTGMAASDPDTAIANRAAEISGLPSRLIERLLERARTPAENETEALHDAQEMELVLSRLRGQS
ncbi:MAG TPA: DUF4350 domain-containing protein [Abditibacteriaceae bacterium]|jgi:hypothetical protein